MSTSTVISPTTKIIVNSDGTETVKISSGHMYYKDDDAQWADVVHGSTDSLAANCEFISELNGFKLWLPNGNPPYNSEWLSSDFWIRIVDLNAISTYETRRATVMITFPNGEEDLHTSCNSNMFVTTTNGITIWRDAQQNIIAYLYPGKQNIDNNTHLPDGTSTVILRFA